MHANNVALIFYLLHALSSSLNDGIALVNDMDVCVFDVNAKSSFDMTNINSSSICMITGPESGFSESEIKSIKFT